MPGVKGISLRFRLANAGLPWSPVFAGRLWRDCSKESGRQQNRLKGVLIISVLPEVLMSSPKSRFAKFLIATLFAFFASLPALADSHVRIVRLSYIEGGVQISHGAGGAYEKAIVNLPITEGAKLKTSDGRAEVEFEDGSTLRIVPDSTVAFSQLSPWQRWTITP